MFLVTTGGKKMNFKGIDRRFEISGFYSAFRFAWDDRYVFHGESHDFWEIVFIETGKVEVTEDEKIYTLEKNNIILHAPMEFHRIRSVEGTAPSGMILTFIASGALPTELRKGIFVLKEGERQDFMDIGEKILSFFSEEKHEPYRGQEAADLLSAFLIRLGSETAERRPDTSPAATEYRKVVSAMTDSVCDNLSLCDFAASCNISVSYIKQLFKKYAGISPKTYYSNLRVQHAIKLLKSGLSASVIADKMNFSSPNYFSVFFKKHTGLVPTEYKKTML